MSTLVRALAVAAGALLAIPSAAQSPRNGGELVFPVPSEPPSYDGHREETFGLIHPIAPFYNTLLRVDPNDPGGTKPYPSVAESWTESKDGKTFTFKIRSGIKFHDGSNLTARDVKASYDKIIFPPPGVGSTRKGQYAVVEKIEAPDPTTVVFRLKQSSGSFIASLLSPYNFIYKADILAKEPNWYEKNIMGSGPFTFVEHVKGSHVVGKKNPNYWDQGKPHLDGFRAIFMSSSSAQVAAVRGERAHIQFRGFTPKDRDTLKQALGDKITVQESAWDCILMVAINHEKKPFDDKRVRRALSLAQGAVARAGPAHRLKGAVADRHRQVRGRSAGARHAVRHAARRAEQPRRLLDRRGEIARRGEAAAQGSRRARRLLVHLQEPRHPDALRAPRRVDDRPVAPGRAQRQAGGDRGCRLLRRDS